METEWMKMRKKRKHPRVLGGVVHSDDWKYLRIATESAAALSAPQ
jgi:hypothetical protein